MKKLECGHSCWLKCRQPCGDCKIIVTKTVEECGHTVMAACGETATVKMCSGPCAKTLACGHRCTKRCRDNCTAKCVQKVPSPVAAACGHAVSISCHRQGPNVSGADAWLLACCAAPCRVLLGCGHRCAGTCGDCLQGRVHVSCREKCSRTLICGHLCSSPCSRSCPPCDRKCEYRCKHSRCTRRCGELCYPCKEKCDWGCTHSQCSRLCYEPCDRQPCQQPCSKSLECGHPCVGFCGDPCPPLCRVCHQPQLTEIFFGYEDEHDARFVLLEDCRHVIESRGLDEWMRQSDGAIKLKCCPLCSTPVMRTQRFLSAVKQTYEGQEEAARGRDRGRTAATDAAQASRRHPGRRISYWLQELRRAGAQTAGRAG
ncbi:NFX1-type zinc finger-containing protein 1-like isoform X2 [Bacillus rossius redtenbacheri]|uniref:NFX1-type zinc finger-containing protein 1-like isoform X2 n=1 Tax=Bacillus rossius redtenbacheri TaxID=93214 RepID=UPI002FDE2912